MPDDTKTEIERFADAHEQDGFMAVISVQPVVTDTEYHELAMRTAAGSNVFHNYDGDCRELVLAVAKFIVTARHLDAIKSRLFYGQPKTIITDDVSAILASGGTDGHCDFDFVTNPQLVHAILGIASESGELAEDLIKAMFGTLYSVDNVVRESGDIDWFQELLATATGVSVSEARERNIERLKKRFPDVFSETDAMARADEDGDAPAIPLGNEEDRA